MHFVQDLVLGGTSGVIAKTACAPLERVKILLQVQANNSQLTEAMKYKGIVDCMSRVRKEQGMVAFWRGNFANCLRYFPTQAMNFAFKEKYQSMFVRPKEEVGFAMWFLGFLAAGGAAGATALTVTYPLEFTYTRLAADVGGGHGHGAPAPAAGAAAPAQRQYTGIVDCIIKTVKSDGIRGIYRGYGPSVAGIIVYRAGYFGLYDFSKIYVMPALNLGQGADAHSAKGVMTKFIFALNIDIFSAMCAYPLDTVRRNMMMMSGQKEKKFTSSLGCFKHIYQEQGVSGFYKGALMNSFRAIGSALVLVLYDEIKHHLGMTGGHAH